MQPLGLELGFFVLQIVSLAAILAWLILTIYILVTLKQADLPTTDKALWTLIVLTVPLLGGLAFLYLKPHKKSG
ncbi:MAG: hypothetical protein AB1453_10205 [Chloroflexota bacterium]|jgi:hypothetical protein